jgi:hypothetical protein
MSRPLTAKRQSKRTKAFVPVRLWIAGSKGKLCTCSLGKGMNLVTDFLKPRLAQSQTTVVIPPYKRLVFVRLLNCTEFSGRLSEISQTLDAIAGIQFRVGAEGWTSGGLLARSASAGAPAYDRGGCGALRSFGVGLLIRLIFHYPQGFASPVHLLVK